MAGRVAELGERIGSDDLAAIQVAIDAIADAVDQEALAIQISELVIREIPELAKRVDEDLLQTVRAAATQSIVHVQDGVRSGANRDDIAPPKEAIAFAYELVHRGVDLGALLRAWRLGHELVEETWERAAEELEIEHELRWRALMQAFRFFFRYVDAVCVHLTQSYADERARWVRGTAATRAEMVHELLDGQLIPTVKASAALGYDVTARHVGFIVWTDPDAPDPGSAGALEGVAASVARSLCGGACMLVPVGNWTVWGWVTLAGAGAGAGDTAHGERLQLPTGVRAALGSPAAGLDGFVRSHQDAMQARRVATLLGRRSGATVHYRHVALLALLSADPLVAARFVETELGELASADDDMARLRATLRAYFEENASPVRASRRLSIHKNTVVYRVAKAEEILGYELSARRPELEAALRLADVLDGLRARRPLSAPGHTGQPAADQLS